MNCDDADVFMMRYMDGELSEGDARRLHQHLEGCLECKEAFAIYDNMLTALSAPLLYEAPPAFEMEVMAKITSLTPESAVVEYTLRDKVWGVIWGSFTVIFGAGTVLALYREPIMNSLVNNPYVGERVQALLPAANYVAEQTESMKAVALDTAQTAFDTLSNSVGIVLGILTIVCALQAYLLHKKKKMLRMQK